MSLGTVISLCDMTGNMVQPWLDAGYKAITVDLQMPDRFMAATDEPDDRIHKAPPGAGRANFRSATPMGFAKAVYFANAPHLKSQAAE
jgi:hypothetical protein